eukprot:TRINITY_DN14299_c0_g3_i1.p1 TRINITY_DN14299_c0_g3~~TRINITY_DN14299_c0_g3_i1.p1  ORF type:complete len:276 (+),score=31.94 TRINITY_DN14299_c0_g3_i1:35-862(+)
MKFKQARVNGGSNYDSLKVAKCYNMVPHNFGLKKPPAINNVKMLGAEKALLQFYLRMGFEDIDKISKLAPISGVMSLPLPASLAAAVKGLCSPKDVKTCEDLAEKLLKKRAGHPKRAMSLELYAAILLYTSNAIYAELNKVLRDEKRSKVEKFFPYLRLLFEACSRLPSRKKTLWRGVSVDLSSTYKVGETIVWWGVSSLTCDRKVAQDFTSGCGDGASLLTVDTENACDISELSIYSNERESILLPGTKLKVVTSKKGSGCAEIHLKEVGRVVG